MATDQAKDVVYDYKISMDRADMQTLTRRRSIIFTHSHLVTYLLAGAWPLLF